MEESSDLVRVWENNDPCAKRIHQRIGEMIAIDCQPFSIVEDVGFTHSLKALDSRYSLPSWKYFTETVHPQIHQGITAELKKEIAGLASQQTSGAQK